MNKTIVTSGQRYTDIDGLASAIAYKEIEPKSLVVLPGPLNQSVTATIKKWPLDFVTNLPPGNYNFVVVDISEPEWIANFVKKDKIIKIYDHRFGFNNYWQKKLGKNVKIEMVGACATLIWEEIKRNKKKINQIPANLLYTAIVSNTLNFKASVTTPRDLKAIKEIKPSTSLPANWIEKYYQEVEKGIYQDPIKAILGDTKGTTDVVIGQIELWDSRNFINKYLKEIKTAMESYGNPNWFFSSPSISEGKNYLFAKSKNTKKKLREIIGASFKGNLGTTRKLWLRKEILKELQLRAK